MLLIAVTGPPGSGKTSLLDQLAAWLRTQKIPCDGFLAAAQERSQSHQGAQRYELEFLADGRRLPFAERDPERHPPYRFDEETQAETRAWAEDLQSAERAPNVILLDEFGPLEAAGGGHMAIWPAILAAQPEIVVIAVRSACRESIEQRLGQIFELQIDCREASAWSSLREAVQSRDDWNRVGRYGAGAGAIEVGLGSILHGSQMPMRGLTLATTQAAVLVYAGEGLGKRERVVWVPFIAAGLKALSPAGSRVRPMLAIAIQGLLFGQSVRLLGWNALGVILGGGLIGAWSAAQGLVLQYLLLGDELLRAYQYAADWLALHWQFSLPQIWTVIGVWVLCTGVFSASVTAWVWRRRRRLDRHMERLMRLGAQRLEWSEPRPGLLPAIGRAAKDLARPLFWMPLLIVIGILALAGSSGESLMWLTLRAFTIAFLLFAMLQRVHPLRWADWLDARGWTGPAHALRRALREAHKRG